MATLPNPPDDLTPEQLFLGHLKLIEEIIAHSCRRSHFSPQDTEDFGGLVKLKLIDDDYAIIRQYQGKCSMRTYLAVVIKRLHLDYQDHLWGKWRYSAEAERLGPVAMRLERLLEREGHSLDEAIQILRINEKIEMSESALRALAKTLPPRLGRRFVGEEELEVLPHQGPQPYEDLAKKEREGISRRVYVTLLSCLKALPKEDQVLVKDRQRFSVAQIARLRKVEQKPLYRRLANIYAVLKKCLGRHGVRRQDVKEVLGSLDPGISDF
jgi:DNA-directed RNA polymerase specialized sigma24 family protein